MMVSWSLELLRPMPRYCHQPLRLVQEQCRLQCRGFGESHQQLQQNLERELKQRMLRVDDAGGDFGESPRPGQRPPCQLLSDRHRLSQSLCPHCSSLRQLQQPRQQQLPQQPDLEVPSLKHLTTILPELRMAEGRGLTPRISSLGAPYPRKASGTIYAWCSPVWFS